MFCYNINDTIQVSWLNGNLVVLFQNIITGELYFSFLGENLATETAFTLLNHCRQADIKDKLCYIPECTRKHINDQGLTITEDRDNNDYILSTGAFSLLKGNAYKEKRNAINKFHRIHPSHHTEIIDLESEKIQQQVNTLYLNWIENKKAGSNETEYEYKAFTRLMENSRHFNVTALGIYVDDKLAAFNIFEILDNAYAICHFGKYDISVTGVFTFLLKETTAFLQDNHVEFLNFEQDLGIAGLRESKLQLRLVAFLKKYIINKK
jgi:hypothetical protein